MSGTKSLLGRKPDAKEMKAGAGPLGGYAVPSDPDEPIELKAKPTRFVLLIVVGVFAVVWNIPIWGMALPAVFNSGSAGVKIGSVAFMIPFMLVGFALIAAVVYLVLARFNPKPRFALGRSALRPGESTTLDWRLEGRTRRLRRLKISVRLQENARYQQGTQTITETEELLVLTLLDQEAPKLGSGNWSGTQRVHIPEGAMHSFDGGNNWLAWEIVAEGEIPRWPDIKAEFKFVVLPAGHPGDVAGSAA